MRKDSPRWSPFCHDARDRSFPLYRAGHQQEGRMEGRQGKEYGTDTLAVSFTRPSFEASFFVFLRPPRGERVQRSTGRRRGRERRG